ncbi:hypothetical protein HKD37_02G004395 [Glycine soja]
MIHGDPPVEYWNDLKSALRKRHIPSYYERELMNKLQRLRQGSMSVEEYRQQMKLLLLRVGLREEERTSIARFLSGLNIEVNDGDKSKWQKVLSSQDVTSLKELGRLMGPLQRQAFRKVYGKILDLAAAEVFTEAVVSLAQYYDQPLRCFTFGDFQMDALLGGRKPYLFSGFLPSLSKIAAVVGDSAKELDRTKQTRNGVARDMASQEKWGPFADILALLIFGVVLFLNVDGLVDLAAIDAFLAYHHSKESPVVAILADLFDTFDRRCEKNSARIVCCLPALCVWLVSHLFQQDTRHPCPLQSYRSCAEKGRVDWDQHLAGIGGSAINWFPRWKEGKEGVLFSCGDYPNIPLIRTRGCINYNPALAIRQLGYPMRGVPTEESLSPFLVRNLGAQSLKAIQRVHKAWRSPLRKDKELRGIRNGVIGGYHGWLRIHTRGLDWLSKLKVINEENFEAPEEDEEVRALKLELGKARLAKEKFKSAATHIRKECTELQEENAATAKALEQETKRARKEEHGREKFRGALWGSNNELKLRREERDRSRSMAHEQKLVEDFAQVYAKKEARGRVIDALHQEATMFALTLNGSQDLPRLLAKAKAMAEVCTAPEEIHGLINYCQHMIDLMAHIIRNRERAPAQRTAPAAPRPVNNTAPGATYKYAQHPKDNFPPIPMAYSELWPSLLENHLVVAIPEKVLQPPYPKWYDPGAKCVYHSGVPGHNIDSCIPFKYKVQHLISAGWLAFQEEGPNVKTNPLASHGGASVNAVEEDGPSRTKRLGEVATPRRFIYQSLQAACMVSRGGDERDECLFHLGESHDMETCPVVEELLQRLMDCGKLEVFIGGKEEPQICMQSEEKKVPLTPKALPGMGLGKDCLGNADVVDIKGNPYKYGLGYEPRMPGRRNVPSRFRANRVWPGRISQCFTSAGMVPEEEVAAIEEEFPQDPPSFVQPCHPDSQVGNWRVISQSEEMALRKLASKRSRKDKAAEGTSSAPEYDSHRFRSAEHQQRFEAIKGWSFLRERRVQLRDDEYTDFQEEIVRRRWASLVTPMAKFDPDIVLEFYANAWPTEEGVRDMRSWVRGQWIPFDADAIGQLLGYPLVLEEGQECEYGQRRNRSDGFDEEAIAQLLCIPRQDFARTAAGRRVRIMRTNMTTLTQIWMTLLLSNILPSDHNSDLPLPKSFMWLSMAPTRHPLDPDKSNRALGFPALITGLCQSFGVPVTPSKVQGDAPQAADAPPRHQAGPAGLFNTEQYLRHLVRQQAANHRAHVQTHDCLYQMSLSLQSQGFTSFPCPTPDQFKAEEECNEVSVSSKRLAKKESHFAIKTNIKETSLLRQPPYLLLCKRTLVSTVIPLELVDLFDEDLVCKSLNPCVLLVPEISIIRHRIPMIGGMMNVLSSATLFCKITHASNIFMIHVHMNSLGRFVLIFGFNTNLGAHMEHFRFFILLGRSNQHENIEKAPFIELVRNHVPSWEDAQARSFQTLSYSSIPNTTNIFVEGRSPEFEEPLDLSCYCFKINLSTQSIQHVSLNFIHPYIKARHIIQLNPNISTVFQFKRHFTISYKIDCNKINEIREERMQTQFLYWFSKVCAYVQYSSNPLEDFHSLCKNSFTKKKEEFSLEKKDITIKVHGETLNGFSSVCPRVSFKRAFGNEVLLESLSFPFERIKHFEQAKFSLQNSCPSLFDSSLFTPLWFCNDFLYETIEDFIFFIYKNQNKYNNTSISNFKFQIQTSKFQLPTSNFHFQLSTSNNFHFQLLTSTKTNTSIKKHNQTLKQKTSIKTQSKVNNHRQKSSKSFNMKPRLMILFSESLEEFMTLSSQDDNRISCAQVDRTQHFGQPDPLGPSRGFQQKAVPSGGSNLARLGELGGNHLLFFSYK